MSGSNNIFSGSPVAEVGFYRSPWFKVGVAALSVGALFGGYVVVRNNASAIFGGHNVPAQPTPQVTPNTAKFIPIPPMTAAAATPVKAATTDDRPKASSPTSTAPRGVATSNDYEAAAAASKIDAYSVAAASPTRGPDGSDKPPGAAPEKREKTGLEEALTPTNFAATGVAEILHPEYIVEAGRYLPCTQMSAFDSTFPGGMTAIIPDEIRGETGDIVLIGRGAKINGHVEHGVANGAEKVFVVWDRITTPIIRDRDGVAHQYAIKINSPASSELGETGLDVAVNRHTWQKVGGVVGLSLLNSGSQGLASSFQRQGNSNNSPTINFNQIQSGTNSAGDILVQQWISRPDVATRQQGKACTVELIRDLDLQAAYKLRQGRNGR